MDTQGTIRVLCAARGAPDFYETPADGAISFALKNDEKIKVVVNTSHEFKGIVKTNTNTTIKCGPGRVNPAGMIETVTRQDWIEADTRDVVTSHPTSIAGDITFRVQAQMPGNKNIGGQAVSHGVRIYFKQFANSLDIDGFTATGTSATFTAKYKRANDGTNSNNQTGTDKQFLVGHAAENSTRSEVGLFLEDDIPLNMTMDEFLKSKGFTLSNKLTKDEAAAAFGLGDSSPGQKVDMRDDLSLTAAQMNARDDDVFYKEFTL